MNRILILATSALFLFSTACGQKSSSPQTNSPQDTKTSVADTKQETILLQKLTSDAIPGEIGYQGDLVEGYRYTDKMGDNIVICTETGVMVWDEPEDGLVLSNSVLYAYHFLKKGNDWEEIWKVYDMEFECVNYPVAEFVKGSLSITDLNNDGVAEIWIMYIKSCKGDVSPDAMFLRMYDNEEIYTMTGENRIKISDGDSETVWGGEYTMDDRFLNRNTPAKFVEYAKEMWGKYND